MNPPVSVKGIITIDGRVVLLRNDRAEWELPGGRVDPGETERAALVREVREELGLTLDVDLDPIDRYPFSPVPGRTVTIVTYGCAVLDTDPTMTVSDEHVEIGTFTPESAAGLADLPSGYRVSIRRHFRN